jgi:hypothetical protein
VKLRVDVRAQNCDAAWLDLDGAWPIGQVVTGLSVDPEGQWMEIDYEPEPEAQKQVTSYLTL